MERKRQAEKARERPLLAQQLGWSRTNLGRRNGGCVWVNLKKEGK
jgi:hypothetical protein